MLAFIANGGVYDSLHKLVRILLLGGLAADAVVTTIM